MSHGDESELAAGSGPVGGARGDPRMSSRRISPTTVLVADNDDFFRAKMESWLRASPQFQCVRSVSDGEGALMAIASRNPGVAGGHRGRGPTFGSARPFSRWQNGEAERPVVHSTHGAEADYGPVETWMAE